LQTIATDFIRLQDNTDTTVGFLDHRNQILQKPTQTF